MTVLWLVVAAATAAASLPGELFPWPWLLAFTAPGMLLAWLLAPGRQNLPAPHALAIAGALLLVLGASFDWHRQQAAAEVALALSLVPPLAFLGARRAANDVLLALFLSFSLLVIGLVLHRQPPLANALLFVLAAGQVLLGEARRVQPAPRLRITASRTRRLLGDASVTVCCALAALGSFLVLNSLAASRSEEPRRIAERPEVGLGDDFELDDDRGAPVRRGGDDLLLVRGPLRQLLQLRLRASFYDVARPSGFVQSAAARAALAPITEAAWRLVPADPGEHEPLLRIHPLAKSAGSLFLPTQTRMVSGAQGLPGSRELAWISPPGLAPEYAVACAPRPPFLTGAVPDTARAELRFVPPELATTGVQLLVRKWTADARDAATKARALVAGLQGRCEYALEEPEGPQAHGLLRFLFGSRRGYCVHFAAALAVMLRLADVPCRVAVGLAGGRQDAADPELWRFAARDAHAWVEVPFPGSGWVPFDATPIAHLGEAPAWRTPRAAEERAASGTFRPADFADDTSPRAVDANPAAPAARSQSLLPARVTGMVWLALLLIVLRLVGPRRRRSLLAADRPLEHEARSARALLTRLLRALARRGTPRLRDETLERYLARLQSAAPPALHAPLAAAFAAYQEVRFGARPFDPSRRERLTAAVKATAAAGR